jgi:hypothetical protein
LGKQHREIAKVVGCRENSKKCIVRRCVKEECHETNVVKLLQLILSGKGLEKLLTKNVMVFRIMRALPSTKSDYAIDLVAVVFTLEM